MIINTYQQSDLSTVGEVQEIKASIDIENINFIATLLSSNLYSQPRKSFLREIVSNAWDAHVEADNTDNPVIIRLDEGSVSIRDYGTGLSKEGFENLYCKIGSSTKRESNSYIGCFGLGHLAPLAVSDIVFITDYFNGEALNYVMVKDNGTIITNFVGSNPTDEHNGLMIKVPTKIDEEVQYFNDMKDLVFFPNLYLSCDKSYIERTFNSTIVKRFNTFSVTDMSGAEMESSLHILLGNVVYPLDTSIFNIDRDIRDSMIYQHVCIHVNIGEINVTPNRESIIYSDNTVKVIQDKINATIKEIQEMADKIASKDIADPSEYYDAIKIKRYYKIWDNTLSEYHRNFPVNYNPKFRGEVRSDDYRKMFRLIGEMKVPTRTYLEGKQFRDPNKVSYRISLQCTTYNKFIAIENNRVLGTWVKQYLQSKQLYWNKPIIYVPDKTVFVDKATRTISQVMGNVPDEVNEICDIAFEFIQANTQIVPEKDINEYKKACIAKMDTSLVKDSSKCILHDITNHFDRYLLQDVTISDIIEYFKKNKTRKYILLAGRADTVQWKLDILAKLGYTVCWIAANKAAKIFQYAYSNPGVIDNVTFRYETVFEKPCRIIQIAAVLHSIMYSQLNLPKYYADIATMIGGSDRYFADTFMEYYNKKKYMTIADRMRTDYVDSITITDPIALSIKEFFVKYKPLAVKMQKEHQTYKYCVYDYQVYLFITYSRMVKEKHPINIPNYLRLKKMPIIKFLYNYE